MDNTCTKCGKTMVMLNGTSTSGVKCTYWICSYCMNRTDAVPNPTNQK